MHDQVCIGCHKRHYSPILEALPPPFPSRRPAPSFRHIKTSASRIHPRHCAAHDSVLDMHHTYKQTNMHRIAWRRSEAVSYLATTPIRGPFSLNGSCMPNAIWLESDWAGEHPMRVPCPFACLLDIVLLAIIWHVGRATSK